MEFNFFVQQIIEAFTAPVDTKRPVKVRPGGKYGTVNPQLNEPHSTKAISGFMGQPGGKTHTLVFKVEKKTKPGKKKKLPRSL